MIRNGEWKFKGKGKNILFNGVSCVLLVCLLINGIL